MMFQSLEESVGQRAQTTPRILTVAPNIEYSKLQQLETVLLLSGNNRMTMGLLRYEARIRGINEAMLRDIAERSAHEPIMTSAERTIGDAYRHYSAEPKTAAPPLDLGARRAERVRSATREYAASQERFLRERPGLQVRPPYLPKPKASIWQRVVSYLSPLRSLYAR